MTFRVSIFAPLPIVIEDETEIITLQRKLVTFYNSVFFLFPRMRNSDYFIR